MFINIPIHIEQIIIKQAQEQSISVSQLITQTFAKPKFIQKATFAV